MLFQEEEMHVDKKYQNGFLELSGLFNIYYQHVCDVYTTQSQRESVEAYTVAANKQYTNPMSLISNVLTNRIA